MPSNDLFRFPDADPPTHALPPPPGLADGPMAPGTLKPDIGKRPYSLFGRLDTLVDSRAARLCDRAAGLRSAQSSCWNL
jgi:hypothetical protein